jgi:MFS superfamily sulfate permease-like transporter
MEFLQEDSILARSKMAAPGLVVCSFQGPLCYANAESFMSEVLSLLDLLSINKGAPLARRWLVVDFDLITEIDHRGAEILAELQGRMEKQGVTLVFATLAQEVADFLSDLGFHSTFRPENVFGSVEAATNAYEALNRGAQVSVRSPG